MYFEEEDFYNESSEFEEMVDDLKVKLKESVKEEHIAEVEKLRKENEELQEVKADFEAIKQHYKEKEQQLERYKMDIKREVRKERLSELMKDREVVLYSARFRRIQGPKCDKCDENRKIHYKTPLGKDAVETCDCDKRYSVYEPREYRLIEFRLDSFNRDMIMFYSVKERFDSNEEDFGRYDSSHSVKNSNIYDGETPFEKLEDKKPHFRTVEECQKFCDYLNG